MPVLSVPEKRKSGVRRDLNGLVRGKDGEISGSKIGTYAAQYIAAKMLLSASSMPAFPTWDVLAILFLVLAFPEAYKKAMEMKWGGTPAPGDTQTTTTDTRIMSKKVTK